MRQVYLAAVVCGLWVVAGCGSAGVRIEKTQYLKWGAYRVSNGTVEMVVAPELGRIMKYGYVGKGNVLWENPSAGQSKEYQAWGGDKVWPWPQGEWHGAGGAWWPPPKGVDPMKCTARAEGDVLVLESGELPSYGVRLVRRIEMERRGTEVRIESRFEKVGPGRGDPVAVWSVTQAPAPDVLVARVEPGSLGDKGYVLMGKEFKKVERVGEDVLSLTRRTDAASKVGMEGDLLAGLYGDVLFVQRLDRKASGPGKYYGIGETMQVYSDPDRPQNTAVGVPPYIEMEFTSPRAFVATGDSVTLAVTWSLHRVGGAKRTVEGVAGLVRREYPTGK